MYPVQLIYDGLVIGSLYALVGLGQVVIFRTTKVLNFSQGAIATAAAYGAWLVMDQAQLPYLLALLLAMAVGAALGTAVGAVMTLVLSRTSALEKSIGSLGFFLLIGWANREYFGDSPQMVERVFDGDFSLAGLHLNGHALFVVGVNLAAIAAVFLLLGRTRLGLGMRALSQDEETARQHGVSLRWVALSSWALASVLGAGSGVLVASLIQVDHTIMTTVMIMSFAALVLGGFDSPIGAVVGGIGLGVVSSLVAGYLDPSYKNSIVFAIILVVLVLRPDGLLGKRAIVVTETNQPTDLPALPAPGSWRSLNRAGMLAALVALVVLLPFVGSPFQLVNYSVVFGTAIVVVSLGVFMGYIGEVSLGHGGLVTIGAYTTAIMMGFWPAAPFPLVLLASAATATIVGGVLGWATLRLSGLYLAIATLVLAFVVTEAALQARAVTHGATGLSVPPPNLLGGPVTSDLGVYFIAAGTFGVVALLAALVVRSRLGQRWVAVRDAPIAAAANGVSVRYSKILAFAISSAFAGAGGSVLAFVVTHVGPQDYGLFFSIFMLLAVVLGGAGSTMGAFLGAAFVSLLPVALNRSGGLTDAVFGIALLLVLLVLPGGVRALPAHVREFVLRRRLRADRPRPESGGAERERAVVAD